VKPVTELPIACHLTRPVDSDRRIEAYDNGIPVTKWDFRFSGLFLKIKYRH
jgi:hypothetical protein